MSKCPYCHSDVEVPVIPVEVALRNRNPNHKLMQCIACDGYSIMHVSGRMFPMDDRANPNGDPVLRVQGSP